jgi:hypothetical protein
MPNIQDSLNKFNELEPEVILTVDGDETVKNIETVAQRNNIETGSLSLVLIFLTVGDIAIDKIAPYLQERLATSAETAKLIADDFLSTVIGPLKKRIDFLNFNPAKQMTAEEEKNYLLEMFLKKLQAEFNDHPTISDAINHRIFYLMDKDEKFAEQLFKQLFVNDEMITAGTVLVGSKTLRGTVGNWLKNFIEINGSSIFGSVALSKYLTDSKSAAKLSQEEKDKVRKILLIYRNLKFFPDSMPDDTGEGWQILPFEAPVEEEKLEQAKVKIENLPKQVAATAKVAKQKAVSEQNAEDITGRLEELKAMAEKYPPNSLSRKAIVEEIKKLSKK